MVTAATRHLNAKIETFNTKPTSEAHAGATLLRVLLT